MTDFNTDREPDAPPSSADPMDRARDQYAQARYLGDLARDLRAKRPPKGEFPGWRFSFGESWRLAGAAVLLLGMSLVVWFTQQDQPGVMNPSSESMATLNSTATTKASPMVNVTQDEPNPNLAIPTPERTPTAEPAPAPQRLPRFAEAPTIRRPSPGRLNRHTLNAFTAPSLSRLADRPRLTPGSIPPRSAEPTPNVPESPSSRTAYPQPEMHA